MPSNPADAKGLLKTAIRDDNPVVFIEDKPLYFRTGQVPDGDVTIPFGKASILRPGSDLTVVAIGFTVTHALAAATQLAKDGIDIEVVDPRTLNPLDMQTITASVKKTGYAIVAHQACRTCGVGAELSARIMEEAFDYLDAPVARVVGSDCPVPYNLNQEKLASPDEGDIVHTVLELLGVSAPHVG